MSNNECAIQSSNDADIHPSVREKFHDQVRQHGPGLLSYIAEQLGAAPPAISITLERVEFPPSEMNWVWFIGTTEPATEHAMLRFFQTDVGKRALIVDGSDPFQFRLTSTILRLPGDRTDNPALPDGLGVADTPVVDGQPMRILTRSTTRSVHMEDRRHGWLQTSPGMQFSQVWHLHLDSEEHSEETCGQATDASILGGWLVNQDATTAYGRIVAIVGSRSVLVAPLLESVLTQ